MLGLTPCFSHRKFILVFLVHIDYEEFNLKVALLMRNFVETNIHFICIYIYVHVAVTYQIRSMHCVGFHGSLSVLIYSTMKTV